MNEHAKQSDTLVCIPCYNSERTLPEVVGAVLSHSDADVLLVDDHSDASLEDFAANQFTESEHRITVICPEGKRYSGGCKNFGIRRAIEHGYRTVIFLDSDIVCHSSVFAQFTAYLQAHPEELLVAASILPFGQGFQYADTLINFSNYLPDPREDVSRRDCLAGYAVAVNVENFARRPCFFEDRMGGDDVLFFRTVAREFGVADFPILNRAVVTHKPPRQQMKKAIATQRRYARAFFTHNDRERARWFNRMPFLHLATPRCWLMVKRLMERRRFSDLAFLPRCWFLDVQRAMAIIELARAGHRDQANTFWSNPTKEAPQCTL